MLAVHRDILELRLEILLHFCHSVSRDEDGLHAPGVLEGVRVVPDVTGGKVFDDDLLGRALDMVLPVSKAAPSGTFLL